MQDSRRCTCAIDMICGAPPRPSVAAAADCGPYVSVCVCDSDYIHSKNTTRIPVYSAGYAGTPLAETPERLGSEQAGSAAAAARATRMRADARSAWGGGGTRKLGAAAAAVSID